MRFADQGSGDSGDATGQDWPPGALGSADGGSSSDRAQSRGTSVCPAPPTARKRSGPWDEAYSRRLARYGVHRDVTFTSQPRLRAQRKTAALCEQILKQVETRRQRVRACRSPLPPMRGAAFTRLRAR